MIIVMTDELCLTPKGCHRQQQYVIPSGFESMLAIFYKPAIPSGLPCALDE